MASLQPIHASLVADLIDLLNQNRAELLTSTVAACPDCTPESDSCATCNGSGAVERYRIDIDALKRPEHGRFVEDFDFKGGQIVPKFRSKTQAFTTLVKMLGFDKAIIELQGGTTLTQTITPEAKAAYVEQLKELVQLGLLEK